MNNNNFKNANTKDIVFSAILVGNFIEYHVRDIAG